MKNTRKIKSIIKDSLGRSSISQPIVTRILKDLFTVVVLIGAGVLVGPLDRENGSLVVVQAADVIAAAVVVLRVKEPVCIIPVSPGLVKTVVGTSAKKLIQ